MIGFWMCLRMVYTPKMLDLGVPNFQTQKFQGCFNPWWANHRFYWGGNWSFLLFIYPVPSPWISGIHKLGSWWKSCSSHNCLFSHLCFFSFHVFANGLKFPCSWKIVRFSKGVGFLGHRFFVTAGSAQTFDNAWRPIRGQCLPYRQEQQSCFQQQDLAPAFTGALGPRYKFLGEERWDWYGLDKDGFRNYAGFRN